jgi:hypothetical protein
MQRSLGIYSENGRLLYLGLRIDRSRTACVQKLNRLPLKRLKQRRLFG